MHLHTNRSIFLQIINHIPYIGNIYTIVISISQIPTHIEYFKHFYLLIKWFKIVIRAKRDSTQEFITKIKMSNDF